MHRFFYYYLRIMCFCDVCMFCIILLMCLNVCCRIFVANVCASQMMNEPSVLGWKKAPKKYSSSEFLFPVYKWLVPASSSKQRAQQSTFLSFRRRTQVFYNTEFCCFCHVCCCPCTDVNYINHCRCAGQSVALFKRC